LEEDDDLCDASSDGDYDPDAASDRPDRMPPRERSAIRKSPRKAKRSQELRITVAKVSDGVPSRRAALHQPLSAHLPNAQLAAVPFPIADFAALYRLSVHMQTEKVIYKDCQKLWCLHPLLEEIQGWIGLTEVKNALCTFMLYELQLHSEQLRSAVTPGTPLGTDPSSSTHPSVHPTAHQTAYYKHMAITGPPGVGKSMIAHTIARILRLLRDAESDEIMYGSRRNMIADYVGQTKTLVTQVVEEALSKSGVLFIDEAPNLMDTTNTDSYGKEVIDTLMEFMDEKRSELVVILAGYRPEMERHIFGTNKGLQRRIQWWFHVEKYTPAELHAIFLKHMSETAYSVPEYGCMMDEAWFSLHQQLFPYYAGSVRNLVEKVLYVQRKDTFGQDNQTRITNETLQSAAQLYVDFCLSTQPEVQCSADTNRVEPDSVHTDGTATDADSMEEEIAEEEKEALHMVQMVHADDEDEVATPIAMLVQPVDQQPVDQQPVDLESVGGSQSSWVRSSGGALQVCACGRILPMGGRFSMLSHT
jgi:adenylate kinase family enzyme